MVDLDNQIRKLDMETMTRVETTLKKINIALKLNSAKLKKGNPEPKLNRLLEWKGFLESWKQDYATETDDVEVMAERLGVFYEVCGRMA